jgi:short-subunit dehydrogenase
LAARSLDSLKTLSASLDRSYVVRVDMTDRESIAEMVRKTAARFGRIDILINNAGRGLMSPVAQINLDDFQDLMALNLYGPLLALQAVVPIMKERGGGTVLTVGSMVSKMAIPGIGAYAATKYATNGLMLTARTELAQDNIRVSIMHPGATATNFGKNAVKDPQQVHSRPGGTQADTPHMVADRILQALDIDAPEYYMTDELQQQFGR